MVKVREELDASRAEAAMEPTAYPTERNSYEVFCDMCGEVFFVDEMTHEKVAKALREGHENPFLCPECSDELGDAAYL